MSRRVAVLADGLKARPLVSLVAVTAALCAVLVVWVDRPLVLWVADSVDPDMRRVFAVVTRLGDAAPWLVLLSLALAACLVLARRPRFTPLRTRLLVHAWNCWFVILSCLLSGAAHHVIKVVVGRFRPRYLLSEDLYGFAPFSFEIARNSFPSGHTQTVVSLCLALYLVYPRPAVIYLLIAALVACSRVIVLAHYPGDVLAGAVLSVVVVLLLKRHYRDPRVRTLLNRREAGG